MPVILPGSGVGSTPASVSSVHTFLELKQAIAKDEGLGYASGTATSGTTTTIVDTSADSPFDTDDSSTLYTNGWAMIESDSAGTPLNVGEVRRVDASGYNASTQTVTTRAFSNAVTNTQSYAIYMGVPPSRVGLQKGLDEMINERLRNTLHKGLFLLTEVTDGDMETSGTTNYSGTNATLVKVTSGAGVTAGDQALQVTTTAANGYCTLATALNCSEGQVWDVVVDCKPTSGIWKLQAWDVTAGAEIDVTDSYNGVEPRRFWLSVNIPDSCETWNVRLIGETDATVAVFDNLSIRQNNKKYLDLPSWFVRPLWLEEVWIYTLGAQKNNAYAIGETNRYFPVWWDVQESFTDLVPFKLEIAGQVPQGAHVFISSLRPYGELSANTDGSDIDIDFLKYSVLMDIYSDKEDKKNYERCAARLQQLGSVRHIPKLHKRTFKFSRPM